MQVSILFVGLRCAITGTHACFLVGPIEIKVLIGTFSLRGIASISQAIGQFVKPITGTSQRNVGVSLGKLRIWACHGRFARFPTFLGPPMAIGRLANTGTGPVWPPDSCYIILL